jgi:hypothetical protein
MNTKNKTQKTVILPTRWETESWSAEANICFRSGATATYAATADGLNGRDTLKGDALESTLTRQVNINVLTMTRTCADRLSGLCLGRRTLAGFSELSRGIA